VGGADISFALHKFTDGELMQIHDVDIKLLRIFDTIVHSGGFSAAQSTLNLSTSTISEYISQLETRVGVRLCNRGRSGFSLTDEGLALHEAAQRMLSAIDTFRLEAATVRKELRGTLHFGIIDATATDEGSPVSRAIQKLGELAPDVHLHVHIDTPSALEQRVLDGRLHLALGPFVDRLSGLDYTFIYREHQGLYCSHAHPLFHEDDSTLTPEKLSRARLAARAYLDRFDLEQLGIKSAAGSVDNVEARAIMILSGQYIGFLPWHYAKLWEEKGELRPVRPELYSAHLDFDLLVRRGERLPRVVDKFRDLLLASASEIQPS
jgi:LysR family transcriptional regulator, transcriptional activator for bauABCD operon